MLKILFAGEGGQGVQAAAQILAKAAFDSNKKVLYIPNFGVEQRGGVSLAFLVVGEKQPAYPKFDKADILAIFSDRSFKRVKNYLSTETKVILTKAVSERRILKLVQDDKGLVQDDKRRIFKVNGKFPPRAWNVLVLGKTVALTGLVDKKTLKKAMEQRFARWFKIKPELRKLDFEALKSVL